MTHIKKFSHVCALSLTSSCLLSTSLYANQPAEFSLLPAFVTHEGIGDIQGAVVGYKNLGDQDFSAYVGFTTGDAEAFGASISDISLGSGKLSFQYGSVDEFGIDTQYGRSTKINRGYRQFLSGDGFNLGYEYPLSDKWTLKTNLLITNVEIEDYETSSGQLIEIDKAGLHEITSNNLNLGLVWDTRNKQENNLQAGIKVSNNLGFTQGRTGQSDQGQWDFEFKHFLQLNSNLFLTSYLQTSHAFIISEAEAFNTREEIRAEINGQCSTLAPSAAGNCQDLEDDLVEFILASNKYGTAKAVGGASGLRSYSEQTFRSANRWLEGVELEYALPASYQISAQGKITLVGFLEGAQLNDRLGDLFDESLFSVGGGIRFRFEEAHIRLEAAHGEDGNAWFLTAGSNF